MADDKENLGEVALGCVVMIIASPFIISLRGWVISILWGWFLTPVFAVAVPSIPLCIGLAYVADAMHPNSKSADKGSTLDRVGALIGRGICFPMFSLLFGWIVHLFV